MADNILYEYLTLIPPNDRLGREAMNMKEKCKNDYGWYSAVRTRPHFTLSNFVRSELNELNLIASFRQIALYTSPFDMHLSGFDFFTNSTYTLYLKVQNERQFAKLVKHIKKVCPLELNLIKKYSPYYSNKPHLTIAKGLSKEEFLKAWPDWENRKYHAISRAENMLILKRELRPVYHKYQIIADLPFEGKEMLDQQMKLF